MSWDVGGWFGGAMFLLWPFAGAGLMWLLFRRQREAMPGGSRRYFLGNLYWLGFPAIGALIGVHVGPRLIEHDDAQFFGMMAGFLGGGLGPLAVPGFRRVLTDLFQAARTARGLPPPPKLPGPKWWRHLIVLALLPIPFASMRLGPPATIFLSPVLMGLLAASAFWLWTPGTCALMRGGPWRYYVAILLQFGLQLSVILGISSYAIYYVAPWEFEGWSENDASWVTGLIGFALAMSFLIGLRFVPATRRLLDDYWLAVRTAQGVPP